MSDPLDKAQQAVDQAKAEAEDYYNIAESKVDGFFARNKYTVVILTAVAIALVIGAYNTFFK